MKKGIITLLLATAVVAFAFSQEKPATFRVQLSTDSILLGNYFEVKFTLENAQGQFEAPDFSENFAVVSGPNQSNSMSIMNGAVSQSMTISYLLEPKEVGVWYIPPASMEIGDQFLETQPLEVLVVPNPDGIIQQPSRSMNSMFQFDWSSDPFENFQFDFPIPPPSELPPAPERETQPKKKKLKTTRI